MMRALYRSVWFWLGCFVLAFLVWVCVDSYKTGASFYWTVNIEDKVAKARAGDPAAPEPEGLRSVLYSNGVTLESGQIMLYYSSVTKPGPGVAVSQESPFFTRYPTSRVIGMFFFHWQSDHQAEVKMAAIQRYHVNMSMWLVVGAYVVLWGGVMVWRRRRRRRLMSEEQRVEGGIA